ncbi:MAG: flagellar biosynthetic protein FliR [Oscillospiraceae bacterium]|nr:flagellar biosynthetic protein FliR [Oscillospiraceae bacterium]
MISGEILSLFSLILMRMSGCVFMNPIFGRRNIPVMMRVGLTVMLSLAIMSFTDARMPAEINSVLSLFVLMLMEFAVGYIIGFVITLFSYAVTFGGEVMDLQLGISMSKVYDPASNVSLSLFATFFNTLYMLLFFAGSGHVTLIRLFLVSGNIVPYGMVSIGVNLYSHMLDLFCQCTVLAVKFMLPVIAIEILIEMGMGLIMKAVPQINVFVINIQIKLFVGFMLIVMLYVPFSEFLEGLITRMFDTLDSLLLIFN